jgi:hypothetical protein
MIGSSVKLMRFAVGLTDLVSKFSDLGQVGRKPNAIAIRRGEPEVLEAAEVLPIRILKEMVVGKY